MCVPVDVALSLLKLIDLPQLYACCDFGPHVVRASLPLYYFPLFSAS